MVDICFCRKTYLINTTIPTSGINKTDVQIKIITETRNQYPDYDTEEKVSWIDQFKIVLLYLLVC